MSTPEEVLSYWFPEGIVDADPQTLRHQMERWMGGSPEVDREITERFGETLEQARRGELDHWADTARGRLALIVVYAASRCGSFGRNRRDSGAGQADRRLRPFARRDASTRRPPGVAMRARKP